MTLWFDLLGGPIFFLASLYNLPYNPDNSFLLSSAADFTFFCCCCLTFEEVEEVTFLLELEADALLEGKRLAVVADADLVVELERVIVAV